MLLVVALERSHRSQKDMSDQSEEAWWCDSHRWQKDMWDQSEEAWSAWWCESDLEIPPTPMKHQWGWQQGYPPQGSWWPEPYSPPSQYLETYVLGPKNNKDYPSKKKGGNQKNSKPTVNNGGSSNFEPTIEDSGDRRIAREHRHENSSKRDERLMEKKKELETQTAAQFKKLLELADDVLNVSSSSTSTLTAVQADSVQTIESAHFMFDPREKNFDECGAIAGLLVCERLAETVGLDEKLRAALKVATIIFRDCTVVRVQQKMMKDGKAFGDKKSFSKNLQSAFGTDQMGDGFHSKMMQAYRKVMWTNFWDAFPSSNKCENDQRGGPRPKRER